MDIFPLKELLMALKLITLKQHPKEILKIDFFLNTRIKTRKSLLYIEK
jgi:hypothetical protein